jgi:hypothetical protein
MKTRKNCIIMEKKNNKYNKSNDNLKGKKRKFRK